LKKSPSGFARNIEISYQKKDLSSRKGNPFSISLWAGILMRPGREADEFRHEIPVDARLFFVRN
jgi:hypothetical protein